MTRFFTISLLLALGISTQNSSAQQTSSTQQRVVDDGREPATPSMPSDKAEAFLGTWEWRSGTEVFRLTLTRELNFPIPGGRTMHALIGRHSYTRNGVVVEESYTRTPNDPTGRAFLGVPNDEWNPDMGYIDRTKNKNGRVNVVIDPANRNQMQFELRDREGMHTPSNPYVPGFTIPTSMTLTRVP